MQWQLLVHTMSVRVLVLYHVPSSSSQLEHSNSTARIVAEIAVVVRSELVVVVIVAVAVDPFMDDEVLCIIGAVAAKKEEACRLLLRLADCCACFDK